MATSKRWFDSAPRITNTSPWAMIPAIAVADRRLTGRQFHLLCALLLYTKSDTGQSFVSQETLAEICGFYSNRERGVFDLRRVSREIKALRSYGWITTVNRGVGRTLVYTLAVPADIDAPALRDKRLPDSEHTAQVREFRDSIEACEPPAESELNAQAERAFAAKQAPASAPLNSSIAVALTTSLKQPIFEDTDASAKDGLAPSRLPFFDVTAADLEEDDRMYVDGLEREYPAVLYQKLRVRMSPRGDI